MISTIEFPYYKKVNKLPKSIANREIVTLRATPKTKNKTIEVNISIGTTICQLIKFFDRDRVNFYLHKTNKNLLLIKKNINVPASGVLLHKQRGNNFLRTSIVYNFDNMLKILETVTAEYEIEKEGSILINISNLKWKI